MVPPAGGGGGGEGRRTRKEKEQIKGPQQKPMSSYLPDGGSRSSWDSRRRRW